MSSHRKRRWEKFGKNEGRDTSSSSDEESATRLKPNLNLKENFETKNQKETKEKTIIGPALPPNLIAKHQGTIGNEIIGPALPSNLLEKHQEIVENEIIGPALPPNLLAKHQGTIRNEIIGPALPPNLLKKHQGSVENEIIGPALPPNLLEKHQKTDEVIGPAFPPHLMEEFNSTETTTDVKSSENTDGTYKDRIMKSKFIVENNVDESSDDDCMIGPDPRLMASSDEPLDYNIAERAERARKKMLGLDKEKPERESWMLELPPERAANIGLGPRQFRGKLPPEMGDRSVWTDTPSDKLKKEGLPSKVDEKELGRRQIIAERDRQMEKMARKAEKKLKRNESLLESHSKKLEKDAKEKANKSKNEPTLRKMFSREEDMQVHKFDEAQKKAIFKKAQFLNDRFSQGESKFL